MLTPSRWRPSRWRPSRWPPHSRLSQHERCTHTRSPSHSQYRPLSKWPLSKWPLPRARIRDGILARWLCCTAASNPEMFDRLWSYSPDCCFNPYPLRDPQFRWRHPRVSSLQEWFENSAIVPLLIIQAAITKLLNSSWISQIVASSTNITTPFPRLRSRMFGRKDVWAQGRLGAGTFGRRDVWSQGRLGAGACASEIFGVWQSSNVNAITGTHYYHQSGFYFMQFRFHPEKIHLLRIACIDPASIFHLERIIFIKTTYT